MIKEKGYTQAMTNNKTRWCSTYNQLHSLVNLKDFCVEFEKSIPELTVQKETWENAESLIQLLGPLRELTIKLQSPQFLASQAFVYLKSVIEMVSQMKNKFSESFLPFLKKRADVLLQNDLIMCSVFFDLRYSSILNSTERERAVRMIMQFEKYAASELGSATSENNIDDSQNDDGSFVNSDLEQSVLSLLNKSKESLPDDQTNEEFNFEVLLRKVGRSSEKTSINILEF